MRLTLETTNGLKRDPTRDEIREALREEGWTTDGFVILSRGDSDFVQIGSGRLERAKGGTQVRWHEVPAPRDVAERVFLAFFESNDVNESSAGWDDITQELSLSGRRGQSIVAILIAAMVIAAIGLWFAMK